LLVGIVDVDAGKSNTLWSDRLVLPKLDIVDHSKYDTEIKVQALSETISLRGRHLEGAVLGSAILKKVDFSYASLQGARLEKAELQGAKFEGAHLQGTVFDDAQLQGALMTNAQLQGASLSTANLQGANLDHSMLHGAWLDGAQLQGASLFDAKLQAAWLRGAWLGGALLKSARLQGALLIDANLESTEFDNAAIWLAEIRGKREKTHFGHVRFRIGREKSKRMARAIGVRIGRLQYSPCASLLEDSRCITSESVEQMIKSVKQMIARTVPQGEPFPHVDIVENTQISLSLRDAALARVEKQLGSEARNAEIRIADAWSEIRSEDSDIRFDSQLAKQLLEIGCSSKGASYVIRGLLEQGRLLSQGERKSMGSSLANSFLQQDNCPGGYGLSDSDKASLKEIREGPSLRMIRGDESCINAPGCD
jgi:uncharacterized protein YjbI with pentapeptide repeats